MQCMTAIHAAAYLLLRAPFRAMEPARLTMLLYLADREHGQKHGHFITDCEHISTPQGPLHREMRDAFHYGYDRLFWGALIEQRAEGKLVALKTGIRNHHLDHLSEAITNTLDDILKAHGSSSENNLLAWMQIHCAEWDQEQGDAPITSLAIFTALGVEDPEIHAETVECGRHLQGLLATLAG